MSDADELAQRYLSLWTKYLTALLADPRAIETLQRWIQFTGRLAYPASGAGGQPGSAPFPAWPPFFGPFGPPAAAPSDAAGRQDEAIAELVRRVDEVERRLTAAEQQLKPRRSSRGSRTRNK